MTRFALVPLVPLALVALAPLAACELHTTDNFVNPPPGPPDTCAAIASLPGCDGGSLSYACTDDRPDDGDANLVCSAGVPGGGGTALFCCAPFSQYNTDCAPDPTLAGCGGAAMGFACSGGTDASGTTMPSDADPTIACSPPAIAADGTRSYCCNTAAVPATCAIDPTVAACTGVAVGYSCVNGDAPFADASTFTCTVEATLGGATGYCCVPS